MRPARQTRYAAAHDLDRWKTDQRIADRGFAHRWDSVVADGNGEDFFLELLSRHLTADSDVLDVGCGHGDLALSIGSRVRSVVGLDRDPGYIALASELLAESGLANVQFARAELAGQGEAHRVRPRPLPLPDRSIDLVVDRRGPTLSRYVDDLLRVARPGAVVVGMHPSGTAPLPPWAASVPSLCPFFASSGYAEVAAWVTEPLARYGITDYRLWWIDVPEYLLSARSLYDRVAGQGAPSWEEVSGEVSAAFRANQSGGAVALRHIRLVWEVRLP